MIDHFQKVPNLSLQRFVYSYGGLFIGERRQQNERNRFLLTKITGLFQSVINRAEVDDR